MARRYINTSQYNPYSFQEMWQPALAATQAHQQQMGAMAKMNAKSNLIGQYIDPQKDPEEYAAWQRYNTGIQQASQDLLTRGLSTTTYNNVYNLTTSYQQDIKPIETALENKVKFADTLREAKLKDPNTFFVKNADDYSLKDFRLNAPQVEYVNGTLAQQQAALLGQAIAKGDARILPPEMYDKYNMIVTELHGKSPAEVVAALQTRDPNNPIYAMKQMVLQSSGAQSLLDNNKSVEYGQLEQLITQGLIAGCAGETKLNLADNGRKHAEDMAYKYANLTFEKEKWNTSLALKKQEASIAQANAVAEQQASLTYKQVPNGAGGYKQVPYFTPGDAKKYSEVLYNTMQTVADGKKNGKNVAIEVTNLKGKKVTLKGSDFQAKKGSPTSMSLTFGGLQNGKWSPVFTLELNGQQYLVQPEQLGYQSSIKDILYNVYNTGDDQQTRAQVAAMTRIIKKYEDSPRYLTEAENQALFNLQCAMVTTARTILDQKAKYAGDKNKYDQE